MEKHKIEEGNIFGKLTIINELESIIKKGRKRRFYKCKCSCGKIVAVGRDSLIGKSTISCGCAYKDASQLKARIRLQTKDNSLIRKLYTELKGNAKYRNLDFNLTYEEFKKLIIDNCHYCNTEPLRVYKHKQYYGELKCNGIDRVDSDKGYLKDNTVSCCYICNRAKMDMEYNEFINYLDVVSKYRSTYVN